MTEKEPHSISLLREFLKRVDGVHNAKGSLNAIFYAYGNLVALEKNVREFIKKYDDVVPWFD